MPVSKMKSTQLPRDVWKSRTLRGNTSCRYTLQHADGNLFALIGGRGKRSPSTTICLELLFEIPDETLPPDTPMSDRLSIKLKIWSGGMKNITLIPSPALDS
jgi:hypothetical protein